MNGSGDVGGILRDLSQINFIQIGLILVQMLLAESALLPLRHLLTRQRQLK